MSKREKREKTVYIDDGSTIADMSPLSRGSGEARNTAPRKRSTLRERTRTYFEAVKMMIVPMLVTIAIISAAFLLVYLLL